MRQVVAAGETPYLEQARFYLAKGLLATNNKAGARQQLDAVIELHGNLEQQAESLLAQFR